MAETLSVTASVIAIITIHDSVARLCRGQKELTRTESRLKDLEGILERILQLSRRPPHSTAPFVNNDVDAVVYPQLPLERLSQVADGCARDLETTSERIQKLAPGPSYPPLRRRVSNHLKLFIQDDELVRIRNMVSHNINLLGTCLGITSCELQQQQCESNGRFFSDIANRLSSTESALHIQSRVVADELSTKLAGLEAKSLQYSSHYIDGLAQSNAHNEELKDSIKASIDALRGDLAGGLASQMSFLQDLSSEVRDNLKRSTNKSKADLLSDLVSDCIDRFFLMMRTNQGDFDKASEEAQVITDDIVTVLQMILEEISPIDTLSRGAKRRSGSDLDEERETPVLAHEERRSIKRMRGILESSQTVQLRRSNWKPDQIPTGRRLSRHNRVINTPAGQLAMLAMTILPSDCHREQQHDADEIFTGTLTIMPKRTKQQAKICARFLQKVMRDGVFSICPSISFHAVVPDDSPVFKMVENGDVESLRKLLDQGLATLTDCDTKGHSLLGRFLEYQVRQVYRKDQFEMCRYLVERGADVNSLENYSHSRVIETPLKVLVNLASPMERESWTDSIFKVLLQAGADPMLIPPKYDDSYEPSSFVDVLGKKSMPLLRLFLDHGGVLVDLEQCDRKGRTPLLAALAFCKKPGLGANVLKSSLEQASLLIDRGANVHAADSEGFTCLHFLLSTEYADHWGFRDPFYIPQGYLTRMLIKCISAGADVHWRDHHGRNPTYKAQSGGPERSWRKALKECGYDPEQVYERSGVSWIELSKQSVKDRVHEVVRHFEKPFGRGWSTELLQNLLQDEIASSQDDAELKIIERNLSIRIAEFGPNAEHAWRTALKRCGWDPKAVYAASAVPWRELEEEQIRLNWRLTERELLGIRPYRYVEEEEISQRPIETDTDDNDSDELLSDEEVELIAPDSGQCNNDLESQALLEPRTIYQPLDTPMQVAYSNEWQENTSPATSVWDQPNIAPQAPLVTNYTAEIEEDVNVWDEKSLADCPSGPG